MFASHIVRQGLSSSSICFYKFLLIIRPLDLRSFVHTVPNSANISVYFFPQFCMLSEFILGDGSQGGTRVLLSFLATTDILHLSEVCKNSVYLRDFVRTVRVSTTCQYYHISNATKRALYLEVVHVASWNSFAHLLFGLQSRKKRAKPLRVLDLSDINQDCTPAVYGLLWPFEAVCRGLRKLVVPPSCATATGFFIEALRRGACSHLQELDVCDNLVTKDFPVIKTLKVLRASGSCSCDSLKFMVPSCQLIQLVDVSRCQLTDNDSFFHVRLPFLRDLIISYNDFGATSITELGVSLECGRLPSLKTLKCQGLLSTEDSLAALFRGISAQRTVQHLDVSNNQVSAENMKYLTNAMGSLRSLELRSTGLTEESVNILATALPRASQVTLLDISDNSEAGDSGTAAFVSAISKCPVIEHLKASHSVIGTRSVSSLATTLPLCRNLKSLDLSYNMELGNVEVSPIIEGLPSSIEVLLLDRLLTPRAVDLLAKKLTNSDLQHLRRLSLEFTLLSGDEILNFVLGITKHSCPHLTSLNIN